MKGNNDTTHSTVPEDKREVGEAEIDKNLQDTFPASDPPSWTLGTDHKGSSVKDESDEDESPRH